MLGTAFSSIKPLLDALPAPDSLLLKSRLEARMESFSIWLGRKLEQGKPLPRSELRAHIGQISEAVLELHRLEPDKPVLALAHECLRDAVAKEVFRVDGERFNAAFDKMLARWGKTQLHHHPKETPYISPLDRASYLSSAEHISGQVADRIANDLCKALDAIVIPAVAGQIALVA